MEETVSRYYRDEVLPKAGVAEFLNQLEKHGFVMAAATSSSRKEVEAALSRCGLKAFFRHIFTCTEVGAGKDRPDITRLSPAWEQKKRGHGCLRTPSMRQ